MMMINYYYLKSENIEYILNSILNWPLPHSWLLLLKQQNWSNGYSNTLLLTGYFRQLGSHL